MTLSTALYQYPKLITVFGGSGFVGRHVVEALTKRGYRVRIAVRRPETAYYMLQIGEVGQTQMLKTNVRNRESVARALIDADAAIFLPGVIDSSGKNSFKNVHIEGAKNVAELASSADIPLIHMSALNVDTNTSVSYMKTKAQGEQVVQSAHKKAIIMRPSVIFGPEDSFFNKIADISRFSWMIPMFGGGKTKLQPVYVGDIAEFVIQSLEDKVKEGQIYELGGKEVITFRHAVEEMLKVILRKKVLLSVPFSVGTLIGGIFGLIGKLPLLPTVLTAQQVKMLKYDSIVSEEAQRDGRTLEGVGITPKAMEAVLPSYLWRFRPHGQFAKNGNIYKTGTKIS
ncbi:complex I NDUFA9 subunit family protein [Bartonella tamiae]|uniref:NAD-dependent epimerase/dehydratase domain-containing protein n=1 Tax=Bartonella tamiae Th239 TaxID=1094558 RepID=J0ZR53_9HYPH|nr:complex I NDUFA9 subunit family protein [Bartonella tamiae]EJF91163.1 hypothetical protein ME5_00495 [Bartonella tamiae Th239]EJF93172.1 hypothetical protein MEG_01386 [Bartonella tamiae Th307]